MERCDLEVSGQEGREEGSTRGKKFLAGKASLDERRGRQKNQNHLRKRKQRWGAFQERKTHEFKAKRTLRWGSRTMSMSIVLPRAHWAGVLKKNANTTSKTNREEVATRLRLSPMKRAAWNSRRKESSNYPYAKRLLLLEENTAGKEGN